MACNVSVHLILKVKPLGGVSPIYKRLLLLSFFFSFLFTERNLITSHVYTLLMEVQDVYASLLTFLLYLFIIIIFVTEINIIIFHVLEILLMEVQDI